MILVIKYPWLEAMSGLYSVMQGLYEGMVFELEDERITSLIDRVTLEDKEALSGWINQVFEEYGNKVGSTIKSIVERYKNPKDENVTEDKLLDIVVSKLEDKISRIKSEADELYGRMRMGGKQDLATARLSLLLAEEGAYRGALNTVNEVIDEYRDVVEEK